VEIVDWRGEWESVRSGLSEDSGPAKERVDRSHRWAKWIDTLLQG